jgi:membrane protein YqaA with SNARE-associated domain
MFSKKWIFVTIALVIIIISIGWLILNNQEFFMSLVKTYGYFGIFLISLTEASTIIFPLPFSFVIFTAGAILNPILVGLSAGLGAAIGEFTGYAIGFGGRKVIEKKYKNNIKKAEKLFQKYGAFLIIVLFAATPLPDDIVGLLGGSLKYSLKKFFIASLIGKIILNLVLAYAGFYGINWVFNIFGV